MAAVWYSSDTHFLHKLVARKRGFISEDETGEAAIARGVAAHDAAIIARWNKSVQPDDLVWHLGDVGLGSEEGALEHAARLNGRKHLIAGNHDRCWPGRGNSRFHQRRWLEVFESVQAFAEIRLDGRTVLLSHFPYLGAGDHTAEERHTQFRLRDEGLWLIHGHTHQPDQVDGLRSLHVGLDAWDLRPASEGAILARMREHEKGTGRVVAVA